MIKSLRTNQDTGIGYTNTEEDSKSSKSELELTKYNNKPNRHRKQRTKPVIEITYLRQAASKHSLVRQWLGAPRQEQELGRDPKVEDGLEDDNTCENKTED